MNALVLLCLFSLTACCCNGAEDVFSHQRVFDWMKTLTNPEIYALISQRSVDWPTYDTIPPASFSCSDKKYPGFYADPKTQCQTFHRCDVNGNMTSYICVNRTVFNPITLICDQWFNVDCDGFVKDEYFGNRRLYTDKVLFDDESREQDPNSGKWIYVEDKKTVGAKAPSAGGAKKGASAGAKGQAGKATSTTAATTEPAEETSSSSK